MDRHELKQLDNQIGELLRHGSSSCVRQANAIMTESFERILRFALNLTEPKPKPKHTIADNYPAGGLTATEPCMYCEDYAQLQTDNKQQADFLSLAKEQMDAYQAEIDQLKEQLIYACNGLLKPTDAHELRKWAEKAREVLQSNNTTKPDGAVAREDGASQKGVNNG